MSDFKIETNTVMPIVIPGAGDDTPGVITLNEIRALIAAGGGAGTWNVTDVQFSGDTWDAQPSDFVLVDDNSGNVTVVLPDATTCKGQQVAIKDVSTVAHGLNVKINSVDAQDIDGLGSSVQLQNFSQVASNRTSVVLVSDGTGWRAISFFAGYQ